MKSEISFHALYGYSLRDGFGAGSWRGEGGGGGALPRHSNRESFYRRFEKMLGRGSEQLLTTGR